MKKVGLLVMAYGTPYKEEDIERYYTHIRRDHKPSEEMIKNLRSRYQAIGGISPLAKITKAQAHGLEQRLNHHQQEVEFKAYIGLKHIDPFIEDAVEAMYHDGIEEAISIVLAPHYSKLSVETYNKRADVAAKKKGNLSIKSICSWHKEPKFVKMWAERIDQTIKKIAPDELDQTILILSAHSLPEKINHYKDPYPHQLAETAKLIFEQTKARHWAIGWQSAGKTGEKWLAPDVQDLTYDLSKKHHYRHFIYAPIGFVSEHLEVLYDNDYECKIITEELGVNYYRPPMPNSDSLFLEALSEVVLKTYRS